jgi:Holliday junction resolvasome RuvABC endonuclease subunit
MRNGQAMIFLGIDPGVSGGMAVIDAQAKVLLLAKMPQNTPAHISFMQRVAGLADVANIRAAIELVHSSPQMGVRSAFTFGRAYERCLALTLAAGIAITSPTPQVWQGAMKCRTRGDKNVTLRAARQLFRNQVVITHATADALLIAEFVRRQHVNQQRRAHGKG